MFEMLGKSNMKGSGSKEFSGKAKNTSEFGKPTALAVLDQNITSLFNQPTQPNTGIIGTTAFAPVIGVSFQTPTAHPKFEGFNAGGTCSLFGTPTATSTSTGGLFGQQNASMGGKKEDVCLGSSNSNTSFRQSKPSGTPLALPTSNLFAAPQTSTANNGNFGASATVLGQTKSSLFNDTTQPNTGSFGSSNIAPVFGVNCRNPTAHPKFEGFNAGGTCSLFGTPTATSTSNGGLFGQQNASMGGKKEDVCLGSSNSNTSFRQSKPSGTPLALPTSNLFAAPQTTTANNGNFGASATVLGQTKSSLFNDTTQPNTGSFGSSNIAPVFGVNCRKPTAHPKFEGFNAGGTCSLFGTPTATSTSTGELFGEQNASMGGKKGDVCLGSSNSNTSFRQSKPSGTPLALPTSNLFAAPQTSTANNGNFGASATGFNAGGTCLLFGTPTATSTSNGELFGKQNASMEGPTEGVCLGSSYSKTSFQQSKPVGTPLAQPTSNIFAAPQTSTANNGNFGTSATVLGQTKSSLFNDTTQPNTGSFGSSNIAPVFGVNCRKPTAHPKFEGFNAGGTCSLFGTPTATSTSNGGLFGQQNASMGGKKGDVCLGSSNSNTSFRQSKPSGTPLALPTSNLFAAPQTSTANNGNFGASATGFKAGGTCSLFGTPTATSTSNGELFGEQNASMEGKTEGVCLGSSNSNTSFRQSKPSGTPLALPTSNLFAAPQTTTANNGNFGTSATGFNAGGTCSLFGTPTATSTSNGGLFGQQNASMGGKKGDVCLGSSNSNTSFRQSKPSGTPLALPTSNLFAAPQTSTANNRNFGVSATGFNAGGTCSLFGTPTATSTSNGELFGEQNASMEGTTEGVCLGSSYSKTSFQQSKPVGTPLAQPTSNIFAAPQTNTAGNGIFSASTTVLDQTKTSLFNQPNIGIFGSTNIVPVFGTSCQSPTACPKIKGGTCSLFGTPTATSTSNGGLFDQQNAPIGQKTEGGYFDSSNSNTSFRQSKPSRTPLAHPPGNIFAATQTSTADTGIFGTSTTGHATSGFGATSADGTTIKFNPVTGSDTCVINGVIHKINTSYQSITVMKEYETKAFEELRFEYYFANRKVEQQGAVEGGIFESHKTVISSMTTLNTGLFGVNDNNPHYGATSTTPLLFGDFNIDVMTKIQLFAAPQTNIFGTTAPSTFATQTTGFSQTGFGQPNQNNLFGQNKPAFGLGSTQTTGFGFGTNTFTSALGIFGSKPNSGFQMTSSAFVTDNTFGATSTAQPATGRLFGSKTFTEAHCNSSLFNQTTNNLTGVFNATSSGGKWKKNKRNEGTGLFGLSHPNSDGTNGSFFGSNKQTGESGLFERN